MLSNIFNKGSLNAAMELSKLISLISLVNISFNIFNISYNYDDLKSILHIIEDKYQKKKKNINNPNNNIIKKVFGNKEKDKDKDKNPSIKPKDILIKEFLSLKPAQSIIINDINETDLMNQNVKEIIETLNKKY